MPMDQFSALVSLLPELEDALKQNGETLPRPVYSGETPAGPGDQEMGDQSPSKQNIDATSDEDEEEDEE